MTTANTTETAAEKSASPAAASSNKRKRPTDPSKSSPASKSSPTASVTKKKRTAASPTAASSKSTTTKRKTASAKTHAKTAAAAAAVTVPITLPPTHTLIVDNGGDKLKYGWITDGQPRTHLPNISARLMYQVTTLVGDEMGTVQNPNSLIARTRSTERGLITNLENQTRVWKRMLDLLDVKVPTHTEAAKYFGWNIAKGKGKRGMSGSATTAAAATSKDTTAIPSHTIAVILMLPPHCPRLLLDQILHIWFEDFGVSHVGLANSTVCASYDTIQATPWKTSCTVDLGWSSTLIVPTFKMSPIEPKAIRRLPLGGRHLINMLKYYMSYRQYNLMEQTHLLRQVFERLSFVSLNTAHDLQLARQKPSGRRTYDRDFVLPDYQRTHEGEIRIPPLLQRDMEREAKAREGVDEDEDDDEEQDEDFELEEEEDDDDDDDADVDDGDVEMVDETYDDDDESDNGKVKKKKPKPIASSKIKGKKKKNTSNDDVIEDDDDDDEEEESLEQRRKRILQERAQEERRKRQQQEEEQVLRISIERFAIPEVLFRPMDAGLQPDLVGLAQAIVQSVEACPMPYRPALYQTVYLVGGLAQLENLKPRLERELRSLIPAEYKTQISVAASPMDRAWMGAKAQFLQEPYTKWSVSRQEWEGSSKHRAYTKLLTGKGGSFV